MKNLVISIFTALLGICCLAIVCSITGRDARSMELRENVGSAVENTVEQAGNGAAYGITGNEELLADFLEEMCFGLVSDAAVSMKVWGANWEKGLLGIEVSEMFHYPNGKEGHVRESRMVCFDQKKKEEKQHYTVKFYLTKRDMQQGENCYKSYELLEGEKLCQPHKPVLAGKSFAGWADEGDYIADFSQLVEEDITYYGEWN